MEDMIIFRADLLQNFYSKPKNVALFFYSMSGRWGGGGLTFDELCQIFKILNRDGGCGVGGFILAKTASIFSQPIDTFIIFFYFGERTKLLTLKKMVKNALLHRFNSYSFVHYHYQN